jgi:hypothetical protein
MTVGFFFDTKTGDAPFYDGGDQLFSTTTLATVGKGVVGVLTHYEETKNRAVRIHDIGISQKKVLEIGKKVAPQKSWQGNLVKLEDVRAKSDAAIAAGNFDEHTVLIPYLFSAIWGKDYGGYYSSPDNELLGLGFKTEADVEAIIRAVIRA